MPWKRWLETAHLFITKTPRRFRTKEEIAGYMSDAGFVVQVHVSKTPGVEEKWFVGKK